MKKLGKVLTGVVAAMSMGLVFMGCPESPDVPVEASVSKIEITGALSASTEDAPVKIEKGKNVSIGLKLTYSDASVKDVESADLVEFLEEEKCPVSLIVSDSAIEFKKGRIYGNSVIAQYEPANILVKSKTNKDIKTRAYVYVEENVTPGVKVLSEVKVVPTAKTIEENASFTFTATAYYSDNSTKTLSASDYVVTIDDETVVSVSGNTVKGLKAGTANVKVSYTEDSVTEYDTIVVTVNAVGDELVSIAADPSNATELLNGETKSFKILPTWKSGAKDPVAPDTLTLKNSALASYVKIEGATITNNLTSEEDVSATFTATYLGKTCEITITLKGKVIDEDEGTGNISIDFN